MIRIKENFTGYPDGMTPRDFRAGDEHDDLPADFAELIVAKGHATKVAKRKEKGT